MLSWHSLDANDLKNKGAGATTAQSKENQEVDSKVAMLLGTISAADTSTCSLPAYEESQ
jgi:hypothetical protein